MTRVLELTDENFDIELQNTKTPLLVVFFAPWCGHCRVQEPILDKLAEDLQKDATIAKINVDDNRITASRYFISGIPSLILFKDGKIVAQKSGVQQIDELKKLISKYK